MGHARRRLIGLYPDESLVKCKPGSQPPPPRPLQPTQAIHPTFLRVSDYLRHHLLHYVAGLIIFAAIWLAPWL